MDKTHFTRFFLRILRILLHLKFPSNFQDFATPQTAFLYNQSAQKSENTPFSRNLVTTERKRRGQGGAMWTENHKRWDANHIACINLMQSRARQRIARSWCSWRYRKVTLIPPPLKRPPKASLGLLFGGYSFRCLKKLKGGDSWIHSTVQRKEHSKTEFEKKNSENEFGESETFYRSKCSDATGLKSFGLGLLLGNWGSCSEIIGFLV